MARRATSLGPPYLFFFFFVFFGGFKGQVRRPEGPPHLALNPPYLVFWLFFCLVFCFFPFPFFVCNKNPVFPLKGALFCLFFECFPFFLPGLSRWPPPFPLSFSLPLPFSLLSSFLLVFFVFFWFLVFVSFFLLVSSLFLLHEKSNIKIFNSKVFIHQPFLIFVGFLSSFSFQSPFLIFVFSYSMSCFLFNVNVF